MAVEEFGCTHSDISAELAEYPAFSASSRPTSTQVTAQITEYAGQFGDILWSAGISPTAAAALDEAAKTCRRAIVLGVAAWAARAMRGGLERARELQRMHELQVDLAINIAGKVLGSAYSGSSGADGPRYPNPSAPDAGAVWTGRYNRSTKRLF